MFAPAKYNYWNNEYNISNNNAFPPYPYNNNNNSNNDQNNNFTNQSNLNIQDHIQPSPTEVLNIPNNNNDYIKDFIDKYADKDKVDNKNSFPKLYNNMYQTMEDNNNGFDMNQTQGFIGESSTAEGKGNLIKRSSILSKFYKPDGTPIKGLWDNDTMIKDQRSYKYDPKPLERRKNPRSFVPSDKKTKDYWEKRRKNNIAARKSREDRRRKEIETLRSVDNMKSDNLKLKIYAQKILAENQSLKYEVDLLKRI